MSTHAATILWRRTEDADFAAGRYSRRHAWSFDGGATVQASASPAAVPPPWSDPAGVDPEEAFVAALSSCHMLWFLSLAAAAGWVVESYEDAATGTMGRIASGQMAFTAVVLRPRIVCAEPAPDAAAIGALHDAAHARCFIAHSVRCAVRVEPAA
jgi:organic hydroperoxide reductase OsmC/OhrA